MSNFRAHAALFSADFPSPLAGLFRSHAVLRDDKWIRLRTPLGAIAPSSREADQIGNQTGYQTHPPASKIRSRAVPGQKAIARHSPRTAGLFHARSARMAGMEGRLRFGLRFASAIIIGILFSCAAARIWGKSIAPLSPLSQICFVGASVLLSVIYALILVRRR